MDDEQFIKTSNLAFNTKKTSEQFSNSLKSEIHISENVLQNYSQTMARPNYDQDIVQIVEIVRVLNNLAPIKMPEYNFNIDKINGERYYKPNGTLLLVRDFDSDVIRDYYYNPNYTDEQYSIARIYEHDKNTGKLRTKIEPITRAGSRLKTNITIFDNEISKKYTIIQLSEFGIVNNISEFTGQGKSFKTLFRNIHTFKPVRYLEGKDSKENSFEMLDCLFAEDGSVVRIKKYNNKKEININYSNEQKQIVIRDK